MKLNLKKIEVPNIEGKKQEIKLDYKGLANHIYNTTGDIGELELARELYKNGELELDSDKAQILKSYVEKYYIAVVKEVLIPILDKIINNQTK